MISFLFTTMVSFAQLKHKGVVYIHTEKPVSWDEFQLYSINVVFKTATFVK